MLKRSKSASRRHGTVSAEFNIHDISHMRKEHPVKRFDWASKYQYKYRTDYKLALPDSSYALIKAWLGAQVDNDMNSQRHQDHGHSRYPGSCEWLLSNTEFIAWVEDAPSSDKMAGIWLKGSPGAGKSHVCSKAIDRVAKSQDLCLYYFYRFDYQLSTLDKHGKMADESRLRMSSLLIDQLLRQLLRDDPSIANRIWKFVEVEEKNT